MNERVITCLSTYFCITLEIMTCVDIVRGALCASFSLVCRKKWSNKIPPWLLVHVLYCIVHCMVLYLLYCTAVFPRTANVAKSYLESYQNLYQLSITASATSSQFILEKQAVLTTDITLVHSICARFRMLVNKARVRFIFLAGRSMATLLLAEQR